MRMITEEETGEVGWDEEEEEEEREAMSRVLAKLEDVPGPSGVVDARALPLVRGGLVPHVGDAYVVEEMVCRSLRRLPELGQTPERITALASRAGHSAGVEHSCPEPPVVRPDIDDVLEGARGGPLLPSFRREVNALGPLLCGVDAWLPVGDVRRQQQQLSTCSAANPSTIIESTSVEECIYIYSRHMPGQADRGVCATEVTLAAVPEGVPALDLFYI
eukprot:SAG11_NODE_5644_length_1488_cov_28.736052_1_plen_218_part_00